MRDPVLGNKAVVDKEWGSIRLVAKGGLHYMRGNKLPYFSLVCDIYERGRDVGGGAAHDLILRHFPHLKPLADLHLADIDGVPMYAAENGWYWIAGADLELGSCVQYHGGSGSGAKSKDECLEIAAKHFRISLNEARGLIVALIDVYRSIPQYKRVWESNEAIPIVKKALAAWVEAQKPRWKAEADKAIADLGLVQYGDAWKAAA